MFAPDAADTWAQAFFDRHDAPAMAFAAARSEGLAWTAARGMANLEFAVPATPAHLFRLGSVSKVVTTVAAARLVSRGLLELDTAIAYRLPDLPEHHRRTTLRQLFTHTGGVRHYGPKDLDPNAPGGSSGPSADGPTFALYCRMRWSRPTACKCTLCHRHRCLSAGQ